MRLDGAAGLQVQLELPIFVSVIPHSLRIVSFLFALLCTALKTPAAEPLLVDIKKVDPTIVVDLRYASSRNIAGRPLYPPQMAALVRPEIAGRLVLAQNYLRERGYKLKIWDAYRPKDAHEQLWRTFQNTDYVADPAAGGSLHTWGIAVDATLVDAKGRDVKMPTDFDDFSPAAMLFYNGTDQKVRRHLRTLQTAMARAGFYGLRTEWWHFVAKGWQDFRPPGEREIMVHPAPVQEPLRAIPAGPTRGVSAR